MEIKTQRTAILCIYFALKWVFYAWKPKYPTIIVIVV